MLISASVLLQRQVVFPRPSHPSTVPLLPAGSNTVWIGNAKDIEAWFLQPAGSVKFPVVIYFHGNKELIYNRIDSLVALTTFGVGVMLVEYPGYGRSGGQPSEVSITAAAVAAFDYLLGSAGVDGSRIIAYGRSIGGGAACALALHRSVAALVLESTFTSIRDMVPLIPRILVFDRFDNLSVVSSEVVPAGMPCGHNDCSTPILEITEFLARYGLIGNSS
jgi:pimeloyl-ACP methyl ester carboxylesterase